MTFFLALAAQASPVALDLPRAEPVNGGWISMDDYPPDAMRNDQQGRVGVTLYVDATGKVASCNVTSSSNIPSLDLQTCALLQRRARFAAKPVISGAAYAGEFKTSINWALGSTEVAGASPPQKLAQATSAIAPASPARSNGAAMSAVSLVAQSPTSVAPPPPPVKAPSEETTHAAQDAKWGLLAQLAGKNWGFGNEGFATYRWVKPGETLIGTVRTFAGTNQTAYVLRPDGTIAGLRKLTETGESEAVSVTASPDRFSVTDGGLRYSCALRRTTLACGDEISADGKRWAVRASLNATEINADQLDQAIAPMPTGFPDWKPGTFDPQTGAFGKLAGKQWISINYDNGKYLSVFANSNSDGSKEIYLSTYAASMKPVFAFDLSAGKDQPLNTVRFLAVDQRHPYQANDPQPGTLSARGETTMYVDGNLWMWRVSPDQKFAILETYIGNKLRADRLSHRILYRDFKLPQTELVRWHSLGSVLNNAYSIKVFGNYETRIFRWISRGKAILVDYIQNSGNHATQYRFCAMTLPEINSGKIDVPCIGKDDEGMPWNTVFGNVTDSGFTWRGSDYKLRQREDGYDAASNKVDADMIYNKGSYFEAAYYDSEFNRKASQQQLNDERRAREQQQQAEMQSLYNSLSLAANRAMANAGMTSTTFGEARTDWSSFGTPAPLPYDASGVYGQATADGGYYVGNGISSKEVEAFQAREQIAAENTGRSASSGSTSVTGVSIAAPQPAKKRGGTLRFFLQAGITGNQEYWVYKWGKENTQTPMCFSHIYEFRNVPGYVAGIDRDYTVANNIIEAQKDAFVLACAAHPVNSAPIHRDAIGVAWNGDGATGSSNSDESIDKAWHNLFDHHHAFVTPLSRSAPDYDDR